MRRNRPDHGVFTDDQRAFMVTQFALGYGPTQIAAMVLERYGVETTKQVVNHYNPLSSDGRSLAEKWRRLYAEVREKMVDDLTTIPIADKHFRLRQLQEFFYAARDKDEHGKAAMYLEQAAKEVGGALTNERNVKHSGTVKVEEVSEEEMAAYLGDKLREEWEKGRVGAPGPSTKH